MLRTIILVPLFINAFVGRSQDTFSIAAVDPVTGEVGSAGASCVDLFIAGFSDPGFLAQQLPGVGSINTQSYYLPANQNNAMARMQAGDTPEQIMAWVAANDAQGPSTQRQYGVAMLQGAGASAAGFTGANCISYANHIAGANFAIQGNILLGPEVLEEMEQNFLNTTGTLADKLMAALQGANVVGADTRCTSNGTSSLFAFMEVAQPDDPFNQPSLSLGVRLASIGVEPIDSLQSLYDAWLLTTAIEDHGAKRQLPVSPNPAEDMVVVQLPVGTTSAVLQLVDAAGRTVPSTTETLSGEKAILPVDHLAPGPYHVVLYEEGRRTMGRFVKE